MNEITITAVQIKCRFDPPARLISNIELSAALGMAYQHLKKSLPVKTSLGQIIDDFLNDESNKAEEKLYMLIKDYILLNDDGDKWYDMLELAYKKSV